MSRGSKIVYWLLLWACRAAGTLPRWVLYHGLLDVIYFFVYKVARYRVKVVRGNLEIAFPGKTSAERRAIERRFYLHLAEVMVDTIDFVGITPKQVRKRLVISNLEEHEKRTAGRGWIASLAHYGSWEYFAAYPLYTGSRTASVYRPLHNMAVDRLMLHSRSRFGMDLVPMRDLVRYLAANADGGAKPLALGMIIDQAPPGRGAYMWFDFFGRPTRFFTGAEKLAMKFNLQIYYFHMVKTSRAHYEGHFEMIYDGRENVEEPGEITRRYVQRLEEEIRSAPELWMWSHRRWKHTAPPDYLKHNERVAAGGRKLTNVK